MKTMMICAAVLAGSALPALADSPQYCAEYSNQAMIAASQNMSHGCGFTGGRWGLDYQTHYNWCVSAPHDAVVQERQLRAAGIVQCHGGPTNMGQW